MSSDTPINMATVCMHTRAPMYSDDYLVALIIRCYLPSNLWYHGYHSNGNDNQLDKWYELGQIWQAQKGNYTFHYISLHLSLQWLWKISNMCWPDTIQKGPTWHADAPAPHSARSPTTAVLSRLWLPLLVLFYYIILCYIVLYRTLDMQNFVLPIHWFYSTVYLNSSSSHDNAIHVQEK